jgi:Uma2 family endonuclease
MGQVIYDNLSLDEFLKLPETKPPLEYIRGNVVQKHEHPVIYDCLTLAQFLRLPEAKPALEFIDGNVVQKVSPNRTHSVLQMMLGARLLDFARSRRLGLPYPELRCTFHKRSIVPDLALIARGRIPADDEGRKADDVELAPDLVIEIISPGQTVTNLSARLAWCVEHGSRLGWLIQPTKKVVHVFRTGQPQELLESDGVLSVEDVLPGFVLPLDELFGWLVED